METKNREKYLAIAVGVCVGLLLLNVVVFTPLTSNWKARQAKIADLRKQIQDGKMMMHRAAAIEDHWAQMNTNTLPNNLTLAESQLFKAFDGWARASYVTLAGQKPQSKDSDDPDYSNMEWRADVTGNLQQVFLFLHAVESSPMALKVESLELTTKDDNGSQLALGLTVSGLILNAPTNTTQ
jgi:Tfp pilus assembly protein PilO